MNKSTWRRFKPGTVEYVAYHGMWQISRGRKPSATLPLLRKPAQAFAFAIAHAYIPSTGVYLDDTIPERYKCCRCGAHGCKLWRLFRGYFDSANLLCCECAAENQGVDITMLDDNGLMPVKSMYVAAKTDNIGWYKPAIPTEDGMGFWGNGAPQIGFLWWRSLPTRPTRLSVPNLADVARARTL